MASIEHDNNCINCLHRHESSTFQKCVACLKNAKQGNQFPEWEPVKPTTTKEPA